MVVILCDHLTERLRFACEVIFRHGMQVDYHLTKEQNDPLLSQGPFIAYTSYTINEGYLVQPSGFLRETDVHAFDPMVSTIDGVPVLFPNSSACGFDVFSAVFFLCSRYEEYTDNERDALGRYSIERSLAARHGFLETPVVDVWVKRWHAELCGAGVRLPDWPHRYELMATVDVDSAFAYRHKGLMRTLGGIAKDIIGLRFSNLLNRLRCLAGRMDDPYDTYAWFHQLHGTSKVRAIWFFLLADFGPYDKGVSWRSSQLTDRIRSCAERHEVGIHPGVASVSEYRKLASEVARLQFITGEPVERSRQHYLAFNLPETFRRLEALEIEEDHSMGAAGLIGFRAGTSRPFPFFDVEENRFGLLMLHPFAVMDATLSRYMGCSPAEGFARVKTLSDQLRACDGLLTLLWHNESASEWGEWVGWKAVYERIIKELA